MNILAQYRKNKKVVEGLYEQQSEIREAADKETYRLKWDVYRNKILKLEQERDAAIREVLAKADKEKEELSRQATEASEVIKKVDRTLTFMKIAQGYSGSNFDSKPSVYYYSNRDENGNYISNRRKVFIEPTKVLVDEPNWRIYAYIVPTRKPVNKFALIVRGFTPFGWEKSIHSANFCYVNGISTDCSNIDFNVRDAKTEKELVSWLDKNKQKVLDMCPQGRDELTAEYEEAKQLLEQKQWQVAYLESQKDYYERHYSRGTETPQYKEICKKLEKLGK